MSGFTIIVATVGRIIILCIYVYAFCIDTHAMAIYNMYIRENICEIVSVYVSGNRTMTGTAPYMRN
jgi:hypothetical protein